MKFRFLKFILFLLSAASAAPFQASSQNLTGIWRGYFITEGADHYEFEIQIEQSPLKSVSGVSYSYLTTVFYGKATLTGTFNPSSKTTVIREIKTVELRMSGTSVACIMKCILQYSKSGKEEFLEGTYTSKYEKADSLFGIEKGGGCGGGKVFLRKVPTSDFYVEPFLRDKPVVRKPPVQSNKPVTKTTTTKPATTKPATKPPVAKTTPKPQPKTTTTKPSTNKPVVTNKPKADTVKRVSPPIAKEEVKKPTPTISIPSVTRSRQNELTQTIDVMNREVTVRLYDNGEIDDDTISVYMNNQLVLSSKRLSAAPLNITLKLDKDHPEYVLVMVAENLGRIPPNTSLMIVQDGDKRYQVRITSTNQKNAMVRFRYSGDDN